MSALGDFWSNWTGTGSFSEAVYYHQAHAGPVQVWGVWAQDLMAPKAKGNFFGLFSSGFPRTGGPADRLRDELEGVLHARQEAQIRRHQFREEQSRARTQNLRHQYRKEQRRRLFVPAPTEEIVPPRGYQSMDRLWTEGQGGWEW